MTSQANNPRKEKETVVLLHSLGTDESLWVSQITALGDRYQVLTPNSRGHAGQRFEGAINVDSWVKDLDAHITPLRRPVHLVGLSMGGVQAIAYAARYPDKVRSLLLANTFSAIDPAAAEAKIYSIRETIQVLGMERYASKYLDDTLITKVHPEVSKRLHGAIAKVVPDDYIESSEATFRANLTSRLPLITAPTLVLIGDRDRKTPLPLSQKLVQQIPDAKLRVIPNAGHLSNIDAPAEFNEALLNFVDSQQSATVLP